ncbi:MAG: hypothetical protein WCQ73_04980, partial [Candidatus Cloacimonadaceae bacterium]|nr:hypothetical protein [Candidatus Cloacimonadota bacterium]
HLNPYASSNCRLLLVLARSPLNTFILMYTSLKKEKIRQDFFHMQSQIPRKTQELPMPPPPLDASSVKADEKNKGSQRKADTA